MTAVRPRRKGGIMERTIHYTIEEAGSTVAEFLRGKGYSHHVLAQMKGSVGDTLPDSRRPGENAGAARSGIFLNGQRPRMNTKLAPGDLLTVTIVEDVSSAHVEPVPMDLRIVYEDEDLIVIDKPADMPIHPSLNNYTNTLANALAYYYQTKGQAFVYRCITRLDRDTTGLLVVAKHAFSAAVLSEMGKRREIRRVYQAIVSGQTPPEGTIDAPLARKEGSVLERCVDFAHGERAVTHFRTLAYENGYSLVELKLETGRTHQIRVHMKYIGHPVIGDFLYNPDYRVMRRQALHSCELAFAHPVTGEQMRFCSPPSWDWPCIKT